MNALQARAHEVFVAVKAALQIVVVGLRRRGERGLECLLLFAGELHLQAGENFLRNFVLKLEHVVGAQVVVIGPAGSLSAAIDQLHGDAHDSGAALVGAVEHRPDVVPAHDAVGDHDVLRGARLAETI